MDATLLDVRHLKICSPHILTQQIDISNLKQNSIEDFYQQKKVLILTHAMFAEESKQIRFYKEKAKKIKKSKRYNQT